MDKLTDRLPEREKAHLHKDFLANEESYWKVREELLPRYRGKWVAVQAGKVLAEADDVFDILDRVAETGGHPYVARVGDEGREFTIRPVFAYDDGYRPFPLPRVTAKFSGLDQLVTRLERILGRDVLNQLRVTFDGPAGRVEIE